MRTPHPGWTSVILPHLAQALLSGRGKKIEIAYIYCINGREPEAFELWAFAEDGIRDVHLFARVQISDDTPRTIFTPTFSMHEK